MKHKRLARAHCILIAAKIHQPLSDELLQHLLGLGMGGRKGKLMKLINKMLPHLSKRRQEQIQGHIDRAEEWGSTKISSI